MEGASNGERAVARQYAGRVAFELLQSALDRASTRIAVRRDDRGLLVANDGRPVECDLGFDPCGSIGEGDRPSNFHALCSMHTSNKSPDEDNGNAPRGCTARGSGVKGAARASTHAQTYSESLSAALTTHWPMVLTPRPSSSR